jgi:phosphatidylglycerol:prolipoprotein diacylglycerol transferase
MECGTYDGSNEDFAIPHAMSTIHTYDTMVVLAAAITWGGSVYLAGRLGIDRRRAAACYFIAAVSMLLGARSFYLLFRGGSTSLSVLDLRPVGFDLYGGLLAAAAGGVCAARLLGCNAWRMADAAVVPTALGVGLVRVGCFFGGCCFGRASDVPWAILPPPDSPAFLFQVLENPARLLAPERIHPTQLYEMAAALLAAAISAVVLARRALPGRAALLGVAIFTALRLAILPLRELGPMGPWYGLTHTILYLVIFAAVAMAAGRSFGRGRFFATR